MSNSNLHQSAASGWLTAAEAAAYLKVKPRSLLLWVRQGKIPAYALAGLKRRVWRFRREDLDARLLASSVYNSAPPAVLTENRRTR
jgi:excisionase family DNA binding protein